MATEENTPQKSRKRGAGRPRMVFTDAQRETVKSMAGYGIPQADIARVLENPESGRIGIDVGTLVKHFADELARGVIQANVAVVQSLHQKARGNSSQAVQAAIWWTKCRMGWKGTDRLEHDVPEGAGYGVLVAPARMTPAEWIEAQQAKNSKKEAPKGVDG